MRRWISITALVLAAASVSQGYYHFLRYADREGKLTGLPQKFDLQALPNKTVSYFIDDRGPEMLAEGDTLSALVSQIQLAARQWNDIETSELRVQFGGYSSSRDGQTTPGIDIVFAEVPPGLIALGGPDLPAADSPQISTDGTFYLIQRSKVVLPKDMSPYPSFKESIFLTIVHEVGHALGLQHTLTSSVMSTDVTRAQTKGKALGVDDIAGISLLYPTRAFTSSLGSISGRVTSGGAGVPLASVVAISPNGAAVSMLSAPDGTYRIDGILPGKYYVYTHPLPPALSGEATPANIQLPIGLDGQPVQPAAAFDLTFYPGVRNQMEATSIPVTAGAVVEGIDFDVAPRADQLHLYNVLSYSFPDQTAVRPAYVNVNSPRNFFVATGTGLMANDQPVDGLQAFVLGGDTQVSEIKYYFTDYLQFDLAYSEQRGEGRRHLIFSTPTDVYVQPGALTLTTKQPPKIDLVEPGSDQTLVISGTNLSVDTTILFDGAPAAIKSYDGEAAKLTVLPPPASNGQRTAVVAFNQDGQSSLFLQGDTPTTFVLGGTEAPAISISPSTLPADAESFIEINGVNTNFVDGLTSLGFGSSDIVVKRLWVTSPTRLLAQVKIAAAATLAPVNVAVTSGLQSIAGQSLLTITTSESSRPVFNFASTNPLTGIGYGMAGNLVVALVGNLPAGNFPTFVVGGRRATITFLAQGVYAIKIPEETPAGPAIIRMQAGSSTALPQIIQVDTPPPRVTGLVRPADAVDQTSNQVFLGDSVTLGLSDTVTNGSPFLKPRAIITVAGIEHLAKVNDKTVTFAVLPSVPLGDQNFALHVDGRYIGSTTLVVGQR